MFFFLDVHIFRMYRQLCEIFRVILRHKTEKEHYLSIANGPKTFKHSQNSIPYVSKLKKTSRKIVANLFILITER